MNALKLINRKPYQGIGLAKKDHHSSNKGFHFLNHSLIVVKFYPTKSGETSVILRRVTLGKFVMKGLFDQSQVSKMGLSKIIFAILGLDQNSFEVMKGSKNSTCYFSKDYGIDLKFKDHYFFTIEFHSTFFGDENAFTFIR